MNEGLSQQNIKPNESTQISEFARGLKLYAFNNRDFQPPSGDRYQFSSHTLNTERFVRDVLTNSGIFKGVYPTPRKIDIEEGIDMFVELPSGRVIAIDLTFTNDQRQMQSKSFKFTSALGTKEFPNIP